MFVRMVCIILLSFILTGCGSDSNRLTGAATRSFLMGTTPFFVTLTKFPDWRFENPEDIDLLSVHADDFWGVPWAEFRDGTPLPAAWVANWTGLASNAKASGKRLYLAVSPLAGRKALAPRVQPDGTTEAGWAPVDGNGCYPFATDANAALYQTAYVNYVRWLVDLLDPEFVSPAIELDITFYHCPAQKAAWIAWYTGVHDALKAAYPAKAVFTSFQMEYMYGVSDSAAACAMGVSLSICFDQRLTEALTIPGDRFAISSYPAIWKQRPEFSFSYPPDSYARIAAATARPVWVSETGWAAVPVRQSYPHGGSGTCGADLLPATTANATEQEAYMRWLLEQADTHYFEAVIWWLNRDFYDGSVAALCPCQPTTSDTCIFSEAIYNQDGDAGETLFRFFANMGLREYSGSPRPAHQAWREYLAKTRL